MASLIKATAGAADANSYVTLAEAEAYFAERLHADAWGSAKDVDKEKALLTACRHIEACRIAVNRRPYGYPPIPPSLQSADYDPLAPSDPDQSLSFPRKKDRNAAGAYAVPQAAKDAQCEETLALLSVGQDQARRRTLQAAGVTSFSVDGLSETYRSAGATHPLVSTEARQLIAPYLLRGGVIATSDVPDGEWTPGSA